MSLLAPELQYNTRIQCFLFVKKRLMSMLDGIDQIGTGIVLYYQSIFGSSPLNYTTLGSYNYNIITCKFIKGNKSILQWRWSSTEEFRWICWFWKFWSIKCARSPGFPYIFISLSLGRTQYMCFNNTLLNCSVLNWFSCVQQQFIQGKTSCYTVGKIDKTISGLDIARAN